MTEHGKKIVSEIEDICPSLNFFYENAYYLTAPSSRIAKLLAHYELFKLTLDLPGEIVECGVFKGASLSRFVKFRDVFQNTSGRKVIAFDIFGKFPLPGDDEIDDDAVFREKFVKESGENSISPETLTNFLENSGSAGNVTLIPGDVIESIPAFLEKHPQLRIALLNIDLDLYRPTLDALRHLYARVVKGGIVILDDYNGFPGATKAIDEFFAEKKAITIKKFPWAASPSYVVKR